MKETETKQCGRGWGVILGGGTRRLLDKMPPISHHRADSAKCSHSSHLNDRSVGILACHSRKSSGGTLMMTALHRSVSGVRTQHTRSLEMATLRNCHYLLSLVINNVTKMSA